MKLKCLALTTALFISLASCKANVKDSGNTFTTKEVSSNSKLPQASAMGARVAKAAEAIVDDGIIYNPAYFVISYPNGDVPKEYGVCTDVVIRSLRRVNIDLQKEVHEDMNKNFGVYPKIWGRTSTDKNIDHRRVPNLMTYFSRQGYTKETSTNASAYVPGDIVAWRLAGGQTHIGVVSSTPNASHSRYMIVHNIGAGQVLEDCLFSFTIIGHYRLSSKE